MMKRCLHISLFSVLLLVALPARAFWGLAIDPYPMPDFIDEAVSYIQSASDLGNNVQKAIKTTEDNINNLKTAVMSVYSGDLSTLVDEKNVNPGQKPMENCIYLGKVYKNSSEDNVYDLTKVLFLQYPGNDVVSMQTYDGYRDAFYEDSIIEIFTAASELQIDMDGRVKPSVDASIECVKGDSESCGTPPPGGNTDALFVEGKAFEALDNLYTVLLKVTALKAQLVATQAIYRNKPAAYVEGVKGQTADTSTAAEKAIQTETPVAEEKKAAVPGLERVYALHHTEELAFAQLGMAQANRSSVSALSQIETSATLSKDSSQQIVDDTLTFVTPPETSEAHPYVYEEAKMEELEKIAPVDEVVSKAKEVHNIIHGLEDYKNAAESMQEMREKYEKALKSLKVADSCARTYISRHFSNSSAVWGSSSNITNYDSRSGISGWALQAYEAAKAAETTETSTGDVVAVDIDFENEDLSDPTDTKKNLAVLQKQGTVTPGKGKEEKAAAEARKSRMISWQIGAEASKMLAAESGKWGSPIGQTAFPIWQDVKSFYNQYLDAKYANVKTYLKPFSKSDVLAVVTERLKGTVTAAADDTLLRKKTEMIDQKLSAEITSVNQAGQQALDSYDNAYQSRMKALQSKRQGVVRQLDKAADKLKSDSDELSDLRNQAQSDASTALQERVTAQEAFPASLDEAPSGNKVIAEVEDYDTRSKKFNQQISKNKAASGLNILEQQIKSEKQKISQLEKQLDVVDAEIKTYRLQAQSGISAVKGQAETTKNTLADKAADLISAADTASQKDVKGNLLAVLRTHPELQKAGLMYTPELVYAALESSAGKALDTLYAQVDQRIDQARKQMSSLADNLYNPDYHSQVVQIHQQMINDIKALAISVSAAGVSPITGIEMYAKLLAADTTAEEDDYFAGRPAKARDINAPKAIFAQSLPPLREMFHFDETDFGNVKPFVAGNIKTSTIINSDFLGVGSEIPPVWEYMLRPHAFVEADIDLAAALNQGCSQVSFFRGGAMPCKVKGSGLSVDMDAEGNYIRSSATGSLPECSYLEARSGGVYHTRREVTISLKNADQSPSATCAYSELGTLFEADKSGSLLFRQPTYDAYYAILDEMNNADRELGADAKRRLAAYDRTPLAFNQIGEFLVYAENEQNMREQLQDLQQQYDAMIKKLTTLLEEYGYAPSAKLDLAKASDYNLVKNRLDNIKNQAVGEALLQIGEIKIEENEVVAERVTDLRNIIAALQKDKDEMTIISGGIDDQNNLDAEIKTSKVNEEVAGKFIDSLNKASASVNLPEAPYCAAY